MCDSKYHLRSAPNNTLVFFCCRKKINPFQGKENSDPVLGANSPSFGTGNLPPVLDINYPSKKKEFAC